MTDAADPPAERRRSRLRWWHAPATLVLVFLLLVLAFVARIHFQWDLIDFRQRAADNGIELDPDKLLPAGDERAATLLTEWFLLLALCHDNYTGASLPIAPAARPRPALPLPTAIKQHYENFTPERWQTIDRLLTESSDFNRFSVYQPRLFEDDSLDLEQAYWPTRGTIELQCDRIRSCPTVMVARQARTALRWISAQPLDHVVDVSIRCHLTELIQSALALRVDDCRQTPTFAESLAQTLERQAAMIHIEYRTAAARELALLYKVLTDDQALATYATDHYWRDWWPSFARATRKPLLESRLDRLIDLRQSDDWEHTYTLLHDPTDEPRQTLHRGRASWRSEAHAVTHFATVHFGQLDEMMILRSMTDLRLGNQLLAAELLDQPWPVDCCDPAGQPLRPLHIDGRLIAAYSVGLDGVDDGGDEQKDLIFWLHGHRDKDGRVNWADEDPAVIYAAQPTP